MSTLEQPKAQLTAEQRLQLEDYCDQFERSLIAGERLSISDLLARTTGPLRTTLAFELICVDLEHRAKKGERPSLEDYRGVGSISDAHVLALIQRFCSRADGSRRVSHFQLQEPLGKGAFGTVWKAIDTRLDRQVALKLAHSNLVESPERFLREARATAQLRHPNIVRVLDVGEHEGHLYIVRELVDGQSLTQVLRNGPLTAARAADLAMQLANALSHSHAANCIHRDVKSDNILIDSAGVPHLVDFGLAKFVSSDTGQTRSGDVLGTPAYMSPEQARGDSNKADARTDIYSLGVVLFEMLTGERPFRGTVEMIAVQVLNDDPPSPARLRRDVPIDLATICLKCLEKSPDARYLTATDLAADLERFLTGRPIVARPVTRFEQVIRWARRKPTIALLSGSSIGLGVLLIAGTTIWSISLRTGWENERQLYLAATHASSRATEEAKKAQAEAEISAQVTAFMENVFAPSDQIGQALGGASLDTRNGDARFQVRRAAERIDVELAGQPRIQARLMDTLGNVLRSIGDFAEAERLLLRAHELRKQLSASDPGPELRIEQARNLFFQGWLKQSQGKYDAAANLFQQARTAHIEREGEKSLPVAEIDFHLGWLELERKQTSRAQEHFSRSLEVREKLLPPRHQLIVLAQIGLIQCGGNTSDLASLAGSAERILGKETAGKALAMVATIQLAKKLGDRAAAKVGYDELLSLIVEALGEDHPVTSLVHGDYAGLLWEIGNYPAALESAQIAIRSGRRFAPNHPRLFQAINLVAFEMLMAGNWQESERLFREAYAIPGIREADRYETVHGLIWGCFLSGKRDDALTFADQTLAIAKSGSTEQMAWAHHCKARICSAMQRPDDEHAHDSEAIRLARGIDPARLSALYLDRLAAVFGRVGDGETSERFLRKAIEKEEASRPHDHPRIADKSHALGNFLLGKNRTEEAMPLLQRALTIREGKLPPDDPRTKETRRLIDRGQGR